MNLLLLSLSVSLISVSCETFDGRIKPPRIAIIGAGISGTSAAYFLSQIKGLDPVIDVYSKDPVGGRLATATVAGYEYEIGGSILHPKNKYMKSFVKLLGLEAKKSIGGKFGLYDGTTFTYRQGNWETINLAFLLWRYGLSIFKIDYLIKDMLKKFDHIYQIQDEGHVFSNVPDLLLAMDPSFIPMLEQSLEKGLLEEGISKLFIQELATAVMRVNYGQLTDAHQFVGSVSLAGADSELWSVGGGNKNIPLGLLNCSKANYHSVEVDFIELTADDTFNLHLVDMKDVPNYDAVIIATPLTKDTSKLKFSGLFPDRFDFPGQYHQIICTMVHGEINKNTFKFTDDASVDEIFTINSTLFFNSLSKNYPVNVERDSLDELPTVWKVFSNDPLTQDQMDQLFSSTKEIHLTNWKAYPSYDGKQHSGNFTLHAGLYHINTIEWAASAMEMGVIGARNVALLTASHFGIDIHNLSRSFHDEL